MEKLRKSNVVFDKESHTYTLDGKMMCGVTPIVKWMFPDTYKDIPQFVLNKAAEHGSAVHEAIEIADTEGTINETVPELIDYLNLKSQHQLYTMANEYLVDDGNSIASSIDLVFDDYSLADIKTTSEIHKNNIRLQLSIYAYLFELCNPGLQANKLMVVWLPKPQYGKPTVMELERIPSEECKKIIDSYLSLGGPKEFDYLWEGETSLKPTEGTLPAKYAEIEAEIVNLLQVKKEAEARVEELRSGLQKVMEENGVTKWTSEHLNFVMKKGSVRTFVDSTRLKKECPEIYEKYSKTTNVKGGLSISIK